MVKEKGESPYTRTSDIACADAQKWWEQNRDAWHTIQAAWQKTYAKRDHLRFKTAQGGPLWEKLFALADDAVQHKMSVTTLQAKVQDLLDLYLEP
jgi:hypothetical protein